MNTTKIDEIYAANASKVNGNTLDADEWNDLSNAAATAHEKINDIIDDIADNQNYFYKYTGPSGERINVGPNISDYWITYSTNITVTGDHQLYSASAENIQYLETMGDLFFDNISQIENSQLPSQLASIISNFDFPNSAKSSMYVIVHDPTNQNAIGYINIRYKKSPFAVRIFSNSNGQLTVNDQSCSFDDIITLVKYFKTNNQGPWA